MRQVIQSSAFRRDVKRVQRRGKDLAKLFAIVERLASGIALDPRHRPHPLLGEWKPKWECHIEPDWLLVYQVSDKAVALVRTGTHADLFE